MGTMLGQSGVEVGDDLGPRFRGLDGNYVRCVLGMLTAADNAGAGAEKLGGLGQGKYRFDR